MWYIILKIWRKNNISTFPPNQCFFPVCNFWCHAHSKKKWGFRNFKRGFNLSQLENIFSVFETPYIDRFNEKTSGISKSSMLFHMSEKLLPDWRLNPHILSFNFVTRRQGNLKHILRGAIYNSFLNEHERYN